MGKSKEYIDVAVTKVIRIKFDREKLDTQFWEEFNSTISDRGGRDIEYIAKHIAWNVVHGQTRFIEGIGPLDEMNITAREIDSYTEIEERS